MSQLFRRTIVNEKSISILCTIITLIMCVSFAIFPANNTVKASQTDGLLDITTGFLYYEDYILG